MEKLVGREVEIRELNRCLNSARSEFVILFGRRRIGKTFLVNAFLQGKKAFAFVGSHKAKKTRQLSLFAQALQTYGNLSSALVLRDWFQAFDTLRKVLGETLAVFALSEPLFLVCKMRLKSLDFLVWRARM